MVKRYASPLQVYGPMYHISVDHELVPILNLGNNVPLFTIHWVVVALLMQVSLYP